MTLKGDYSPSATYAVGDVVRYQGSAYEMKELADAGTPPTWDRAWKQIDQNLWDVVDMILAVATLNVSDDGIILKGENGDYLISVDDSGDAPELAVEAIEEGD